MSDYTKSTNFASKDSLSVGNPLKIVKGTEIDTEFNNIATAVATKADIANPVFTGTPLAPSPSLSATLTQLATVATVQSLYPIGSLYLNASNATNPATLLGFGTWTAFGAGRMPVGFNASNPLFDTAEETGGSYDATLVSHNHAASTSVTLNDPGHNHGIKRDQSAGSANVLNVSQGISNFAPIPDSTVPATTGITVASSTTSIGTSGSSATNANLPPYITVYMWKRIA